MFNDNAALWLQNTATDKRNEHESPAKQFTKPLSTLLVHSELKNKIITYHKRCSLRVGEITSAWSRFELIYVRVRHDQCRLTLYVRAQHAFRQTQENPRRQKISGGREIKYELWNIEKSDLCVDCRCFCLHSCVLSSAWGSCKWEINGRWQIPLL